MEEPSFRPGFNAYRTWRGAAWVNTAWLMVGGLRALGAGDEADRLAQGVADAVERSGFREYYHPRTGRRPRRAPVRLVDAAARPPGRVFGLRARGSANGVKLLVVTPEPIDAAFLRETLGDEVEGAEVLVLSPATNQSKLAFWVSDPDDAIAEAEEAQTETVERLEEEGVDAAGEVGESEPAQAIDDALATFAADRIVIFSHPEGDRDYREDEALAAGEARWNVPVTHALISR